MQDTDAAKSNFAVQPKLRGLYLVTDRDLQPGSGAWHHVQIGVSELRRYFDIDALILSAHQPSSLFGTRADTVRTRVPRFIKEGGVAGTARDILKYIRNKKDYELVSKTIEAGKYKFIYERAGYLSDVGLSVAKARNIRHFYEVNGIQYLDRMRYYRSHTEFLTSRFERKAYSNSDHIFFVGTRGDLIQLSSGNWENIENGVEGWFVNRFHDHIKPAEPITRLCFVGHHMSHHRLDRLVDAVAYLKKPKDFELNFIGSGFDRLADRLGGVIKVVHHGILGRLQLARCLEKMHVGLVLTEDEFASNMKIFDYGAAKMLALVADTHNARAWFPNRELMLFEKESPRALASALETIAEHRNLIQEYGERLHKKVKQDFTWEIIFHHVADVIRHHVEAEDDRTRVV